MHARILMEVRSWATGFSQTAAGDLFRVARSQLLWRTYAPTLLSNPLLVFADAEFAESFQSASPNRVHDECQPV